MKWGFALIAVFCLAAVSSPGEGKEGKAKFKVFKSKKGSTLTCPENWKASEKEGIWTIEPPEMVSINISSYKKKGTVEDFFDVVTNAACKGDKPKGPKMKIKNNNWSGYIQEFTGDDDVASDWICMGVETKTNVHAITLNGMALQIKLNRGFYFKILNSFKGHDK